VRWFLTALAVLAGASILAVSAPPAHAVDKPPPGVGIRLVDVPVATAADPRARAYIIDHVAPGTVIERRVEVSNGTDDTARVSMYPAAAEIRGDTFTGVDGHTQNELSSWISLNPRAPVLDPQERTMVDVTITVPRRASRGERYGVVWAQVTNSSHDGGGVSTVDRVGIRIYLSIGAGGNPPSGFTITSLTAERDPDGTPLVHATVRNTGERALDLDARLTLTNGPGGISAGPFLSRQSTTLGLDQTAPVTMPLNKALPRGPWRARITVTSGLDERTEQATVTFPVAAGAATPVPVENVGIPWWVLAQAVVLLLALLLAILAVVLRRRSRHLRQETPGRIHRRMTGPSPPALGPDRPTTDGLRPVKDSSRGPAHMDPPLSPRTGKDYLT